MKLGVLVLLTETGMEEKIAKLREMNFDSCQLCGWNPELFNDENAEIVNLACKNIM